MTSFLFSKPCLYSYSWLLRKIRMLRYNGRKCQSNSGTSRACASTLSVPGNGSETLIFEAATENNITHASLPSNSSLKFPSVLPIIHHGEERYHDTPISSSHFNSSPVTFHLKRTLLTLPATQLNPVPSPCDSSPWHWRVTTRPWYGREHIDLWACWNMILSVGALMFSPIPSWSHVGGKRKELIMEGEDKILWLDESFGWRNGKLE